MTTTTKDTARARALRTARVVTLGLALAQTAGCESATNAYCDVFPGSETCCARNPGHTWDPATRTCNVSVMPVVGPVVPPG
jgi:hypothetical protein